MPDEFIVDEQTVLPAVLPTVLPNDFSTETTRRASASRSSQRLSSVRAVAVLAFAVLAASACSTLACSKNLIAADNTPAKTSNESSTSESQADTASAKELVATFAGGCFWCTEAVFERMNGVNDVVSGYIGGRVANPTYKQVCSGMTGHAEAVEIYYDPSTVTFEELLEVHFKTHDPTTLNRQGADRGTQYRSSVFFHNEQQKKEVEKYIEKVNASGEYKNKVVTKLEEASRFYTAEEYHQDYFRLNPNAGYCQAVVRQKVRKFNRNFGDKIKKD